MSTFATAHTLCASRNGPRKSHLLTAVTAKTGIFARFISTREKQILGKKGYWNSERKLGVITHFSEIIKLQFGKKIPYILLYFGAFWNYFTLVISKIYVVTPNFLFRLQ